jgi:hypothetical protein
MAGNNNRVHGYNPLYRNPHVGGGVAVPRFESFAMGVAGGLPNPGAFANRPVVQAIAPIPPLAIRLDHQGHIVSQQTMNLVLDAMMLDMSNVCNSPAHVATYIAHPPHNAGWLAPAVAYGNALGIPMFDFATPMVLNNAANAETRVGNLFSIVTWNPVNICRAPDDMYRNGIPGANLDYLVLNYLRATPGAAANAAWMAAATTLAQAPGAAALPALAPVPIPAVPLVQTAARVTAFLTASTATLAAQLGTASGYYQFNWHAAGAAGLLPG